MDMINGNEPMLKGSMDALFNATVEKAKRDLLIRIIQMGADAALNNDTLLHLDEKYLADDQHFNQAFWAELEEMCERLCGAEASQAIATAVYP